MPITAQQKLEILQKVGVDPDKYWLDDDGNVIDLPKDSSTMAGAKTALLNLPRTAAGIGGAALGAAGAGALGLPAGPAAVATGLAGGFAGGAAGATLGEMFQNAVYPDDVRLAQEARQVRNPVATQVGDLASTAAFMRPSISQTRDAIRGVRALTTLPKFANMRPSQSGALMNMAMGGTIEGASTLAQGGDASEIAKNAAIGAVFSNPTKLSQMMTRGVFSPHVPDMGLRDVVNPADLIAKPGEPVAEKSAEVNPELLKAFAKQQKVDAKLAEQLAALKANQEAAAKKAQIDAAQGIGNEQPLPAQDFTLPQDLNSLESRFLRSTAVEPDVAVTLDPQVKAQPKPPVIAEPGTPGALDQELGTRMTKPFFDWWANNAGENYRTRMNLGRPTGDQGQSVAGVTEGTRGADGKRNITVDEQAYTDTAPHELTHGMILDVLQHGNKGEQAEMRRLLKAAGVEEEAFVQGVGEDVVRRFMDKTDDSWRSDFVSFMKYKFGKASPEDARRIMSNTMLRGGGPKGVAKIVAKPTQETEEKPPVIPEPPKAEPDISAAESQSVEGYEPNMGEFKPDYAAQEPEVKALDTAKEAADVLHASTAVTRPENRTYSGESIPANVRRGRANATNERESAADLEARRIEARLSGEERPRYQEFGEDRTFSTDFEKELSKDAPFKIRASKDGRLNRNDIEAAVSKLNPTEQKMLKEAGLEQYLTKVARPTKEELKAWAEESIPRVEVKELYAKGDVTDKAKAELAQLTHNWYDNLSRSDRSLADRASQEHIVNGEEGDLAEILGQFTSADDRAKARRYAELKAAEYTDSFNKPDNDSATQLYTQVNPRELKDMPGAVDLLVRMPRRQRDTSKQVYGDSRDALTVEPAKYPASNTHYDQSGDNLLAHVRAYEHTMPDGEKVLRVFELQSDWAQKRRKAENDYEVKINPVNNKFGVLDKRTGRFESDVGMGAYRTEAEAEAYKQTLVQERIPNDPLLAQHQRLALKAAIEHARKRGIKRVVIDDAETAMLTEGHDKIIRNATNDVADLNADIESGAVSGSGIQRELPKLEKRYKDHGAKFEVQDGKIVMTRGPFEGGMKLSYDNVLQQQMRDLTGEGVKVELGEHKNAMELTHEAEHIMDDAPELTGNPRADLIFRNPDGTPKTTSTGYVYDVSAPQARREAGEPFSYAGRRYQQFGANRQTETPEFKKWFGDSVVKDAEGKPLVVYHGSTDTDFTVFDPKLSQYRKAIFFTPDYDIAKRFANKWGGNKREPRKFYLKLENPLYDRYPAREARDGTGYEQAGEALYKGHDGFVLNPIGERVGDKLVYAKQYAVFDPRQIKSADNNTGAFDPANPDIRYQQFGPNRPTSGLPDAEGRLSASPFESASQKAARSSNPVMRTVGRALTELFPAQRAMRGKYRALPEAFAELNEKDKDLLYKILIDEYRAGKTAPGTVPARLKKEYNDVRRTLRQMRDDQIAAGQRNADGAIPGIDDSYFPNVVDPSVRKTIVDEIDSPRFKQLRKEFVDFNEAHLRSKGYTNIKAAEEANKFFNRFIGTLNKQPVEGAFDFGAVVLPEGSRLPDNWLHSDPAEAMSQYVRDWSRSRTFHDIVQTNEDVMAGLGQEEFFVNGKKTPVKNRVTPVVKDSNILHLLNESLGIRKGSQDKITGAVGRAASAAWLANPITRSVDIATSLFKGLGMVTPSQIPGLVSNLRNLGKSYERAHDTGWIREDGNTIVGEVLGAGEAFSNGVDKFSKGLSKYTGSEKLENFGRGLSQNIGEYIARTNTALAQSGNRKAADFLDRVSPNWRILSEAELGTRIGQLFQGRYDATNLPQWLSDSPAAPFFSLARWNIEQWNNFREFAIKPARNGDPVPLISMLVAGLAGGVGIKEIREALSGRKSKIATLKEIAEAPEGSAKYKEAVRYLGNLAQLSGTMGIVSEMSNWGLDIASKDMPAAASMPALEVTRDIIPRLIAAGNAMMDGEDPLTVITQVSRDIGNEHVSAYRFLEGNLGRTGVWSEAGEDLADANARRDLRVGKRLRGEPIKAAVQLPIDYSRAEERAVEKERDPVKMRQMARELKADIKSDPDKDNRERRMRSAAASRPSYMPSRENDPKAFNEQLDFVRRTQGPAKAEDLRLRYMRDKKNADTRRKMFN